MKRIFFPTLAFAFLLILSGAVEAEEIDSVILASEAHYPDALVAGVAADRIGAPFLLTEPGRIPEETLEEIEDLNISKIYIIGGPYAVSEDAEDGLSEKYDVVRIWGMTRYGTSAAVAEYFWEESSKAVLVWDVLGLPAAGNSEIVAEARGLAQAGDAPLLLIPRNVLPEAVSDALINLSVREVTLVGDIGSQVEDDLAGMGINITERIWGKLSEIRERIREKVKNLLGKLRPLVVVAVGNWSDLINVPYRPNGTSRHISGEDQIDSLIEEINQENYTRIIIVGRPALAQEIYDRLADAGINATLISGRPLKVAANIMRREREIIRMRKQLYKLNRNVALLLRRAENLEARAERTVSALNSTATKLEKARVALNRTAILEKATVLRDKIRENINLGKYEEALESHKILENEHEQLKLRNIEKLKAEVKNIISREKIRPTLIRRIIRR